MVWTSPLQFIIMVVLVITSDSAPGAKGQFSTTTFGEVSNLSPLIHLCQGEHFRGTNEDRARLLLVRNGLYNKLVINDNSIDCLVYTGIIGGLCLMGRHVLV